MKFKRPWYVLLKKKQKTPHIFPEYFLFSCLLKQKNSFLPCRDSIIGMHTGWEEGAIVTKKPANNTLPIHWPGILPAMQKSLVPLPLACFHGRSNAKGKNHACSILLSNYISVSHRKSILGPGFKTSSPQYKTCFLEVL